MPTIKKRSNPDIELIRGKGFHIKPADIPKVAKEFQAIREAHGGELHKMHIVAYAKSHKRSTLHKYFEWNVTRAAFLYWIEQAGYIIRAVYLKEEKQDEVTEYRAFVHLKDDNGGHYQDINVAMSDPVSREQIIAMALRDLKNWKKRYGHLKEFVPVRNAINVAIRNAGA